MTHTTLRSPAYRDRSLSAALVLCCLLMPIDAAAQNATGATPATLYDLMLKQTEQELLLDEGGTRDPELSVKAFAASTVDLSEGEVATEEIADALENESSFCTGNDNREQMTDSECDYAKDAIRTIVTRESEVRAYGRDWMTMGAGSFERPLLISEFNDNSFLTQLQAITTLWRASGDTDRPPIVAQRLNADEEGSIEGLVGDLRIDLERLVQSHGIDDEDRRDMVAAVWDERYGILSGNGAETRWPNVHADLVSIANTLANVEIIPALGPDETSFLLFTRALQESLPFNVRLWAYVRNEGGANTVNVGLNWQDAVEPTLPDLCDWQDDGTCRPRRAGHYPDPSSTAPGLCNHRLDEMGYLCRPMANPSAECRETPDVDPNVIALARCQSPKPATQTQAGPNVCENWAEGKSQMLGDAPQCSVEITCEDKTPIIDADAVTTVKDADGKITIVLRKEATDGQTQLPAKYLILSQLVHAKRLCASPAGTGPLDGEDYQTKVDTCCRVQMDSARAACDAMEEDGVFRGKDDLNADLCAQVMTEEACRSFVGDDPEASSSSDSSGSSNPVIGVCKALPTAARMTDDELNDLNEKVRAAAVESLPEGESPSCAQTAVDGRIDAAIRAVNDWRDDICTPENAVVMRNTIGDATCYIGLCVKQSRDSHRQTPAQNTIVSGGTSPLFDTCVPRATDVGDLRAASMELSWTAPVYNPTLLLKQTQTALCVGGPPSILCDADVNRLLETSPDGAFELGASTLEGIADQAQANEDLTAMTDAIVQRMGNDFYASFLQSRIGLVNGVIREAGLIFTKLTAARFPATLCPMTIDDRDAFLDSDICASSPSPSQP